jgi:alkylation response protein AidB-like acyl-CoA dehydrogenase
MDFSLTKEQKDIKKAAAEFARGEFQPDLILECESSHRFPREIYKKAGELGFIGLDYPEDVEPDPVPQMAQLLRGMALRPRTAETFRGLAPYYLGGQTPRP